MFLCLFRLSGGTSHCIFFVFLVSKLHHHHQYLKTWFMLPKLNHVSAVSLISIRSLVIIKASSTDQQHASYEHCNVCSPAKSGSKLTGVVHGVGEGRGLGLLDLDNHHVGRQEGLGHRRSMLQATSHHLHQLCRVHHRREQKMRIIIREYWGKTGTR